MENHWSERKLSSISGEFFYFISLIVLRCCGISGEIFFGLRTVAEGDRWGQVRYLVHRVHCDEIERSTMPGRPPRAAAYLLDVDCLWSSVEYLSMSVED